MQNALNAHFKPLAIALAFGACQTHASANIVRQSCSGCKAIQPTETLLARRDKEIQLAEKLPEEPRAFFC